jgi:hypothetical protein
MSIPPQGFPAPPGQRGPSCWTVGGIGCLVVFVIAVVLVLGSISAVINTKGGRDFMKTMNSTMKTASDAAPCVSQMAAIQKAVLRYREHTGAYPPNLKALSPSYLPNGTSLHCAIDSNDDPGHVTYTYFKPTDTTPKSATLLQFSFNISTKMLNTTQTQTITYSISIDGKMGYSTTQTTTSGSVTPLPAPAGS